MSDSRERILARVREALREIPVTREYPHYEDSLAVTESRPLDDDRWAVFVDRLIAAHSLVLESPGQLAEYLKAVECTTGYCDPELHALLAPHFGEGFTLETTFDRERVDRYQFGITRARAGIAETGTLVLTDRGASPRLAALAPWVHVACLRKSEVARDTPAAVILLGDDPNVIWVTGPSKTADVEGILIEGVHGPGVQICLLLPEIE